MRVGLIDFKLLEGFWGQNNKWTFVIVELLPRPKNGPCNISQRHIEAGFWNSSKMKWKGCFGINLLLSLLSWTYPKLSFSVAKETLQSQMSVCLSAKYTFIFILHFSSFISQLLRFSACSMSWDLFPFLIAGSDSTMIFGLCHLASNLHNISMSHKCWFYFLKLVIFEWPLVVELSNDLFWQNMH